MVRFRIGTVGVFLPVSLLRSHRRRPFPFRQREGRCGRVVREESEFSPYVEWMFNIDSVFDSFVYSTQLLVIQ